MDSNDTKLLRAIHEVDSKVVELKSNLDNAVEARFKDHDRRLSSLESNQRWVSLAVIGACLTAVMTIILK